MRFREAIERIHQMLKKEFIQTLRDPHTRWLLIGPPIIAIPANARGSAGNRCPVSSATSSQRIPCASSHSAKWPGPSVGEKRKMTTGFMQLTAIVP